MSKRCNRNVETRLPLLLISSRSRIRHRFSRQITMCLAPPAAVGILLLLLSSSTLYGCCAAHLHDNDDTISFEMHPSAQLLLPEHHQQRPPEHWFDSRSNAVYATLPKKDDDDDPTTVPADDAQRHSRMLQDFHAHRHLSRYELHYRIENDLELQTDWDGNYHYQRTILHTNDNDDNNATASRHDIRRRKLRQQEPAPTDPYQAAPLSQGYGTHYAHVWVGSPVPQRKSVIVDTGSHYTAFPCKGCHDCGEEHHTDPYYDFSQSATFRPLPCQECKLGATCHRDQCIFSQSYTEGSSWEAFQAQDMFYCGGNNILASADQKSQQFSIPFLFGCQTAETGLFVTQLADGIMGMSAHDFTLPKQMFDAGRLERNMFSLCFRRELATSKRGVTAGFMTLGGVDSRLDMSPMVYARNIAASGWFTVYVKNIFIRSNGGQSATNILEADQHILKIPLDLSVVNSGKGVIVDSGTTDTYLHKNLAQSFVSVWKQVTGKDYTHSGIALSKSQLMELPTILIQCQATSHQGSIIGSPDGVIGLAGRLDPSSPHDVLISIPATNYMEYSPTTDLYTSRLYFTETRGGVLGANAMQGHNVVFDWQNGQVGFAESTCEYREEDAFPETVKELNKNRIKDDCTLGVASLRHSCVDSLDLESCRSDPSQTLRGFEQWTRIVNNAGTEKGMSCIEAGMLSSTYTGQQPPRVECDNQGLCTESRPCEFHCAFASTALDASKARTDEPSIGLRKVCESDWSACDRSCVQTKVVSQLGSDGICHERAVTTRPCHTGACGGLDRCLIPFFVHSVIGLRGVPLSNWSRQAEEWLSDALLRVIRRLGGEQIGEIFTEGDVDIMMTSPWDAGDPDTATKIVLQISVFNPHAITREEVPEYESAADKEKVVVPTTHGHRWLQRLRKWAHKTYGQDVQRQHTCAEIDLYPQARQAMKLHDLVETPEFIPLLVQELRKAEADQPALSQSPFQQLYGNPDLISQSKILSAWTIRTADLDEPKPTGEHPFLIKRLRQYANRSPFMTMFTGIFLGFIILGSFLGSYEILVWKHMWCFADSEDDSNSIVGDGTDVHETEKLLPTRVLPLPVDDTSAASRNSIDELFEHLVSTGRHSSSPARTSPRRRNSLDNGTYSNGATGAGDVELSFSPKKIIDLKKA